MTEYDSTTSPANASLYGLPNIVSDAIIGIDVQELTVIPCVRGCKDLLVLLNQVGKLQEKSATIRCSHPRPLWRAKCLASCTNCLVHILSRRALNCDNLFLCTMP